MSEAKWYVVHTYSGYENKVKVDIEKTIENRNLQDQILAACTVTTGTLPVRAALGAEVMLKAVIDQRRQLSIGLDDDIAATTAVAAIGAALGDKCLAPKRHASGSAVAAAHVNAADIGEL